MARHLAVPRLLRVFCGADRQRRQSKAVETRGNRQDQHLHPLTQSLSRGLEDYSSGRGTAIRVASQPDNGQIDSVDSLRRQPMLQAPDEIGSTSRTKSTSWRCLEGEARTKSEPEPVITANQTRME